MPTLNVWLMNKVWGRARKEGYGVVFVGAKNTFGFEWFLG